MYPEQVGAFIGLRIEPPEALCHLDEQAQEFEEANQGVQEFRFRGHYGRDGAQLDRCRQVCKTL